MQKGKQIVVNNMQLAVAGKLFRTLRLSHEWFQYLDDPKAMIKALQDKPMADLFTFVAEVHNGPVDYPFYKEIASASVMKVPPYEEWWKNLDFKVRNKVRKAQKSGVELKTEPLSDAFAAGVEKIYNECPIRQGRKFHHFGKSVARIKEDLSSFPESTCFVGAYHAGEMIGFMKLYQGNNIMRTVHIIAMLSHRDKPVQDALIAKAVEICNEKKIGFLHYGDWDTRSLGAFRMKHGFEQHDCPRYFVPLTARGKLMLKLKLHHPLRERLPVAWQDRLVEFRNKMNAKRYGLAKGTT